MKKYLIALAAVFCLAGTSQAASILWSVGNGAIKSFTVSGETITEGTANLADANLYFILGTLSSEDVASAFTTSGFTTPMSVTLLDQAVSTKGGSKSAGSTPITNSGISADSATPFSLVIASQLDSEWYYKVINKEGTGYDETNPQNPSVTLTFTANEVKSASWTHAAVPEPSVAIMGLLGIGMLLKRRRA